MELAEELAANVERVEIAIVSWEQELTAQEAVSVAAEDGGIDAALV